MKRERTKVFPAFLLIKYLIMDIETIYQTLEFEIYSKLKQNPEFPPTFIVMNLKMKVKIFNQVRQLFGYSYQLNFSFDNAKFRGLDIFISEDLKDNEFKVG